MSIGSNIRELREAKGLTQEKLAEKLGVTFQAVSSWERNEYKPETANLLKLADELNVPVTAIVEEKKKTFRTKEAIYDWEQQLRNQRLCMYRACRELTPSFSRKSSYAPSRISLLWF